MRGISSVDRALSLAQAAQPKGTAGAALERFQQVLENTTRESDQPQLVTRPESLAAVAESAGPAARLESPAFGPADGSTGELSRSLSESVGRRLASTRESEQAARKAVQTLLTGGDIELHDVMLAAQRAQLELQYTMRLRNKLLEAYQEVMRLPV